LRRRNAREFAFYGPIGFDLGAFFGNLLLSWYSQFGHQTAGDDRSVQRAWILDQVKVFWTAFRIRFLALWAEHPTGDAFPKAMFCAPSAALESARAAFMDTLFQDMLGFGACKMIRRILGSRMSSISTASQTPTCARTASAPH
jgi:5-methylthioribose kinase